MTAPEALVERHVTHSGDLFLLRSHQTVFFNLPSDGSSPSFAMLSRGEVGIFVGPLRRVVGGAGYGRCLTRLGVVWVYDVALLRSE